MDPRLELEVFVDTVYQPGLRLEQVGAAWLPQAGPGPADCAQRPPAPLTAPSTTTPRTNCLQGAAAATARRALILKLSGQPAVELPLAGAELSLAPLAAAKVS